MIKIWAFCPACLMERPVTGSSDQRLMSYHRRYDGKQMVECEGSYKPPAPASSRSAA